jgi:predicted Zn-dependent peptidase
MTFMSQSPRKSSLLAGSAAFLFLLFLPAAAAAMAELEKRVFEETLDNGLRVLVLPRHQSPTVALKMRFRAGSVEEEEGRSGLAHLLEHMMFKGTRNLGTTDWERERPLRDRIDELAAAVDEERGKGRGGSAEKAGLLLRELAEVQEQARRFVVKDEIDSIYSANGAQGLNAGTSADFTTYQVSLPSNRLELWARIESERMRDPVMREFYSERDVVVEERRQSFETDPYRKLMSLLLTTAFQAHPYRRPVIGWASDVERLRAGEAESFYRTYYAPNNAVLAAVGDVDPEGFFALVRRYFGPLPAREIPRIRLPAEPEQEGERRAVLLMDAQPVVMIAFHKPTLPDEDDYAFDLIDGILSRGRSSRLYRRLVEEAQVALSVSTVNGMPGARFPNLFVIRAAPRFPHTAAAVEEAILAELDRLVDEPVSAEELKRVRKQMRADMIRGLRSNEGLAHLLSYFEMLAGDWRYLSTHLDVMERITSAQVQEAAARYLTSGNRTVVTLVTRRPGEEGK